MTAPETFLFTFRPNGEFNGKILAEILVEQLADYDPSVAPGSRKLVWHGNTDAMQPMLLDLGFSEFDVTGVVGALGDHRNADRRLDTTPDQLEAAAFTEQP